MATGENEKEPVGVVDGCVTSWLVDVSQDQERMGLQWCSVWSNRGHVDIGGRHAKSKFAVFESRLVIMELRKLING